jgi:hypothetical protein
MRYYVAARLKEGRMLRPIDEKPKKGAPPRALSTNGGENSIPVPPSPIVYVKLVLFGECKCTIAVPENISRDDLQKRASQEFQGRVAIQPEMIPVKEGSTVVCYPTYVPEVEKWADKIPTVTPYLEREQKLYPVEVPADATFENMVEIASNIMGCPCMLRSDTGFPLRTDDHVLIATAQDIHLEQMKLEALRAEDELKNQQRLHAIQLTMADLPPRPASRELPTSPQTSSCPPPESVSKWGEEIEVKFEDVSGTQGSKPTGYVYAIREGTRWDRAASEAFGLPMQVVDTRTAIEGGSEIVLKCRPVFGMDEMTAPVSAPKRRPFQSGTSYPVNIKLQFQDRMVPLEVLSSSPAGYVESQARIHFGAAVEFSQPKHTAWTPGQIYQMKMVRTLQSRGLTYQTTSSGNEVKIKMTVKYSRVNVSIPNIVVPRTAAAQNR